LISMLSIIHQVTNCILGRLFLCCPKDFRVNV